MSSQIQDFGDYIVNRYYVYKTRKDLLIIKTGLDAQKEKNGLYPPYHRFSHWYKTALSGKLAYNFPLDRWGNPFLYKALNNRVDFIVTSAGMDNKINTDDDISITSIKNDT